MTLTLNTHGEIVDVQEADQFQWASGKPLTQFACGYFAALIAKSMALPGYPPTLTVQQVITDALSWYLDFVGTDAVTNTNGMTDAQLYSLLQQIGLHFQATATNVSTVKGWIEAGYPVIIAITEGSVHDLALGDNNPYPWTPAGTHIILVTGALANGNLLVRDSANCTDLYNPNSLRPGPRTYDAGKLQLVSATVVVPPWMPRPQSATPPAPLTVPTATSGVPAGWKDDGHNLYGPHGEGPVILGFRDFILAHSWDPSNVPLGPQYYTKQLEASNPDLGDGDQILFLLGTMLGYPHNPKDVGLKNKVIVEYAGKEIVAARQQVMKYYTLAVQMHDYAARLQADLQAFQTALPQQ